MSIYYNTRIRKVEEDSRRTILELEQLLKKPGSATIDELISLHRGVEIVCTSLSQIRQLPDPGDNTNNLLAQLAEALHGLQTEQTYHRQSRELLRKANREVSDYKREIEEKNRQIFQNQSTITDLRGQLAKIQGKNAKLSDQLIHLTRRKPSKRRQ